MPGKRRKRGVLNLNFLIYPCEENPGRFVAHCLELDIVAVEDTIDEAIILLKNLVEDLLESAAKEGTLDKVFRAAPRKYWKMLARAKPYPAPDRVRKRRIHAPTVNDVAYAFA